MPIAQTRRPILVVMLLLIASLVVTLVAPMLSPGGGTTAATTTLYNCQGTWYFDSSTAGTTFDEGDTWQGGEFTFIEDDHMMLVRLDNGHEVGRFPNRQNDPFSGDSSTITFAQPVRIVAILWHDNDPNTANGETGWSLNGIAGPLTGNNGTQVTQVNITTTTVNISAGGDSGGIDFCFVPVNGNGGGEGCTPGYWKAKKHLDSWVATGFSTTQTLESVFDVPDQYGLDNVTLHAALSLKGGSGVTAGARLLLHHAVASLLNASHPNVSFASSTADVINATNAALATGNRQTMLALKNNFDAANNAGCPLN